MEASRKIVTASPENSETPLETVAAWVTPNRLFFVRNHFEPPAAIDPATWELSLDGLVAQPRTWTPAQLAAMPQRTVFATVECAGNGRSFLTEKAPGVQWGAGAIGHAEWTGVPLCDLLAPAGLAATALEVVFAGADRGTEDGEEMNFSRSLPLEKALHPDTILALRMNGEALEPNHGAPLRLFVPGWYGVASVKWLRRMTVIDHAYPGHFQTVKYTIDQPTPQGPQRVPLGPGRTKSEILIPRAGTILSPGTNRIAGLAWTGESHITRVEVSTDGGRTWQAAHLQERPQPYSWCRWECLWTVASPGDYTILARARAANGDAQPDAYAPGNLGYLINHVLPRQVRVTSSGSIQTSFADDGTWAGYMEAFAEENTRRPLDVELALTAGDGI